MKNRILTFIIGVLTGAIIMTLVFTNFTKQGQNFEPNRNGQFEMPGGTPPQMPNGQQPNMPNGQFPQNQ